MCMYECIYVCHYVCVSDYHEPRYTVLRVFKLLLNLNARSANKHAQKWIPTFNVDVNVPSSHLGWHEIEWLIYIAKLNGIVLNLNQLERDIVCLQTKLKIWNLNLKVVNDQLSKITRTWMHYNEIDCCFDEFGRKIKY